MALRAHLVHAHLGERAAVGVQEAGDGTPLAQAHQRDEGCGADAGADQRGERGRESVGGRGLDLVAYAGIGRVGGQLEVPALVATAGAPPQGDVRGGESQVLGVVVGGVQFDGRILGRGGHRLQPAQSG
jgi:hypothetical protein